MISIKRLVITLTGKYFIAYLAPVNDRVITNNGTIAPIIVAPSIRVLKVPSIIIWEIIAVGTTITASINAVPADDLLLSPP